MRIFLVILIGLILFTPVFETNFIPLPDAYSAESEELFLLRVVTIDRKANQVLLKPVHAMENGTITKYKYTGQRQFFIYRPSILPPPSFNPGDLIRIWGNTRRIDPKTLSRNLLKKGKGKEDSSLPLEISPDMFLEVEGKIAAPSPGSRLDPTGVRRRLLKKRRSFPPHKRGGGIGRP